MFLRLLLLADSIPSPPKFINMHGSGRQNATGTVVYNQVINNQVATSAQDHL